MRDELRCDVVRVCRGRCPFQSVSQGLTGVSSSVAMVTVVTSVTEIELIEWQVDAENSRQILSLTTHPPIHHSNKKNHHEETLCLVYTIHLQIGRNAGRSKHTPLHWLYEGTIQLRRAMHAKTCNLHTLCWERNVSTLHFQHNSRNYYYPFGYFEYFTWQKWTSIPSQWHHSCTWARVYGWEGVYVPKPSIQDLVQGWVGVCISFVLVWKFLLFKVHLH